MWRYFSKLNIDALVEITKRKKEQSSKDEQTTFADIRKRWGNHRKSIKNRMKRFYAKEPSKDMLAAKRCSLSDDDLGSQAASCSTTASGSTRSSLENNFEKGSFVMNEIEKYRKGEKHIFGSLGRLRKSRTSLCLEEMLPKKKTGKPIESNVHFQQELRKEMMNKRSAIEDKIKVFFIVLDNIRFIFCMIYLIFQKNDQCHSKFYN